MSKPYVSHFRRSTSLLFLIAFLPEPGLAERFRMGVPTPPSHVWTIEANVFASSLEQATGGEHTVTVFPAGQLGNDAQMLQQLQTGALDFVFMPVAEIANRLPEFGALYAPYLVQDVTNAARLLKSPEARGLLDQLPGTMGIVGIGYAHAGMRQIVSREAVDSAEDLRGLKLRITPLEPIRDFYLLLGAAPIPLPIGSVYDAFANGQIDAIDMDMENTWKQRYFTLGETVILSNHMMFPMIGLVSGVRWRTLAPEMRERISTLMSERFDSIAATYVQAEVEYETQLRDAGIEVRAVGPEFFEAAVAQWEEKWQDRAPILGDLRRIANAYEQGEADPADPGR